MLFANASGRDEDSEDEMEESSAAAKKFGMTMLNDKAKEKKRTDHTLSMMLQRQAQVAKAKAAGSTGAAAGAGVKRKQEKVADVGFDDLLADFDAPAAVPKKKAFAAPRSVPKVCTVPSVSAAPACLRLSSQSRTHLAAWAPRDSPGQGRSGPERRARMAPSSPRWIARNARPCHSASRY